MPEEDERVWEPDDPEPLTLGLIHCQYACGCVECNTSTIWRAKTFDIHVCSKACMEKSKDVLECPVGHHDED